MPVNWGLGEFKESFGFMNSVFADNLFDEWTTTNYKQIFTNQTKFQINTQLGGIWKGVKREREGRGVKSIVRVLLKQKHIFSCYPWINEWQGYICFWGITQPLSKI